MLRRVHDRVRTRTSGHLSVQGFKSNAVLSSERSGWPVQRGQRPPSRYITTPSRPIAQFTHVGKVVAGDATECVAQGGRPEGTRRNGVAARAEVPGWIG